MARVLGAAASPSSAGGIGVIASPAFDNLCVMHSVGALATNRTLNSTGLLNGNLGQAPLDLTRNHCGSADPIPTLNET